MKDIKKNYFKNNFILDDDLIQKNILCNSKKLEKIQKDDPNFIKLIE